MADKQEPLDRTDSPLEINLFDGKVKHSTAKSQLSVSVPNLSILLVVLVLILGYAMLPFAMVEAAPDLPNLYGYMSDKQDHVADLEAELAQRQDHLSGLKTNLIPQAKSMLEEIDSTTSTLVDYEQAYDQMFTYAPWSDVVEEIDDLAPAEIDLTYIAQDGNQVVVEGITDASIRISEYAHALLESELFHDSPPYDPDIEWTYQITERGRADLEQTPQMYDNWTGEATLVTAANVTVGVEYWAVIVGVADYPPGQGLTPLSYTDDDAEDVREVLLDYPNWQDSHITMLIDDAATKSGIEDAIDYMAANGDADDVFFFYFSGHGGIIADQMPLDEADDYDEVLCPYDFDFFDPMSGITDDELGVWLGGLPGSPVLVAIDTCYSGGMFKYGLAASKGSPGEVAPRDGDGFARDLNETIEGVVLTACDEEQYSYEDPLLENGVFTYYFVEGLNGPADVNEDDTISMEEAYDYLYWEVTGYTPPYAFIITVTLKQTGGAE